MYSILSADTPLCEEFLQQGPPRRRRRVGEPGVEGGFGFRRQGDEDDGAGAGAARVPGAGGEAGGGEGVEAAVEDGRVEAGVAARLADPQHLAGAAGAVEFEEEGPAGMGEVEAEQGAAAAAGVDEGGELGRMGWRDRVGSGLGGGAVGFLGEVEGDAAEMLGQGGEGRRGRSALVLRFRHTPTLSMMLRTIIPGNRNSSK
jgi:hypothetical protein